MASGHQSANGFTPPFGRVGLLRVMGWNAPCFRCRNRGRCVPALLSFTPALPMETLPVGSRLEGGAPSAARPGNGSVSPPGSRVCPPLSKLWSAPALPHSIRKMSTRSSCRRICRRVGSEAHAATSHTINTSTVQLVDGVFFRMRRGGQKPGGLEPPSSTLAPG